MCKSNIAHAAKPQIRVLGTKGGIVDANIFDGGFILYTQINGMKVETKVTTAKNRGVPFYTNVADHLYRGAESAVKPEEALRIIAAIEATGRSAAEGRELPVPYEKFTALYNRIRRCSVEGHTFSRFLREILLFVDSAIFTVRKWFILTVMFRFYSFDLFHNLSQ